jgi:Tfp pilus assembly protein PilO
MTAKNIFGAFSAAAALFFFWPAVMGSWAEVGALEASLAEHQRVLAERSSILAKARDEYSKYQSILQSPAGQYFPAVVPLKKDSAELVSAIQTIAQNSGMQISNMQFSDENSKEVTAYHVMSMAVEFSGPYTSLRNFLADLESYVRVMNVQSLEIGKSKTQGILDFKIRANTYYGK